MRTWSSPLESLLHIGKKLLYLGIKDDMPFFERQKIHLMNVLVIPGLPSILFFTIVNFFSRPGLAFLNLASLFTYSGILCINIVGRFLSARILLICISAVVFFLEALLYNNGIEYTMLLMITAAVVIIEKRIHYFIFSFSIVLAFCYLKFHKYILLNDDPGMISRVVFNIFFCLVLFVIALQYFKNIYLKYHQEVQENRILLEQQQRQLLIQTWELEEKNEELKIVSDSRQRILFTLAHDLRNPLSGIEALSKRMLASENNTGDHKSLLTVIEATAERSQKQIQELLDANQYLGVGEELKKTTVNINELLQEVVNTLQFKAAQKAVDITLHLPAYPIMAAVNPMQVSRVIENLLVNAIKFSHQHSSVRLSLDTTENDLLIDVSDEGIGVAPEKRRYIFDNFSAARQTGTMGEKSFGLGLSICKQIVEAHGGIISLMPDTLKGCKFKIVMPLRDQV